MFQPPDPTPADAWQASAAARHTWFGPVPLALLAGAACMTVTGLVWHQASLDAERELRSEFEHDVFEIRTSIELELATHALVMKSFAGLFNASTQITRQDFRVFYESLGLDQGVYHFAAVAFVEHVDARNLDRHLTSVHRQGLPDYRISPTQVREVYAPTVFIEPFAGDNHLALGFDPYTVLPTRVAMMRARDTAALAMSGQFTLRQDVGRDVPGFALYQPVYRPGTAPDTPAQRQARLLGWIDVPFRAAELFGDALQPGFKAINLKVFDGTVQTPESLMFDSAGVAHFPAAATGQFESVLPLVFGGHTWTLVFRAQPGYGPAAVAQKPQLLAVNGTLLSMMLALFTGLASLSVRRHQKIALRKMVQAQQQEATRALQESAWAMNEAQRIGQVGSYWCRN